MYPVLAKIIKTIKSIFLELNGLYFVSVFQIEETY